MVSRRGAGAMAASVPLVWYPSFLFELVRDWLYGSYRPRNQVRPGVQQHVPQGRLRVPKPLIKLPVGHTRRSNGRSYPEQPLESCVVLSPLFPVFVASIFYMTNKGDQVIFGADQFSYYVVLCFLIVYAVSLPFTWPRTNRLMPRYWDLMSLFYASNIMRNPALDISAKNIEKRHLESKLFLEEGRFQMGLFTGVDGKKHFGVDYKWLGGKDEKRGHILKVCQIEKKRNMFIVLEEEDEV